MQLLLFAYTHHHSSHCHWHQHITMTKLGGSNKSVNINHLQCKMIQWEWERERSRTAYVQVCKSERWMYSTIKLLKLKSTLHCTICGLYTTSFVDAKINLIYGNRDRMQIFCRPMHYELSHLLLMMMIFWTKNHASGKMYAFINIKRWKRNKKHRQMDALKSNHQLGMLWKHKTRLQYTEYAH